MRYLFGFLCVSALGVMPLVGCSETTGDGGSGGDAGSGGAAGDGGTGGMAGNGGSAGTGGMAGSGGTGGMPECQSPEDCDDGNDCTANACIDGMCDYTAVTDNTACDESNECTTGMCASGECDTTPVADGTACGDNAGTCQVGSCQVACTEQGIRDAIAAGGGPYTFDCVGPQTVVTEAPIVIDNDVELDGEGNLTVDGDDDHRLFAILRGVTVTLEGLSITKGYASEQAPVSNGGGIHNEAGLLTLIDCTVSDNNADGLGGGIFSVDRAETTLVNTAVTGNSPTGIVATASFLDSPIPSLTLVSSTVSGNSGGGIIGGDPLILVNSTVSGNTSTQPHEAAIVAIGDALVISSTISGNSGGPDITGGQLTIANSLVDGDCHTEVDFVVSGGYNIESPGDTCGFNQTGDQSGVTAEELNLGPLQDNGGPTATHALGLLPTPSVAIDRIPEAECLDADGVPLTTDQRGEERPVAILGAELKCDVGAFERQADDP